MSKAVDIIIPVYDGYEETKACIESVLSSDNECESYITLINDGSPNKELSEYLDTLQNTKNISLLVNDTNLGFVKTVNKGMKQNTDRDVVLVNSDTLVANNWLDRLIVWAEKGEDIASVTPFSNNAEICSYPGFCKSNNLLEGFDVATVDSFFSDLNDKTQIPLPTGVGFCMYMTRSAIDDIGYFDEEAFGRGYGEENDWCQRAIQKGYKHLLATDTFVFHEGGVSFSDEKKARVENAMQILDKKYPSYHRDVHEHIQLNPAHSIRQLIQLRMLCGNQRQKLLYITHDMGGGILTHIEEMQGFFKEQADLLVLRPCSDSPDQVELAYTALDYDLSIRFSLESDWPTFLEVLRSLNLEKIHFHHLMRVPEKIWTLAQVLNLQYCATLHDYYFINGNPTLTDGNGVFVEDIAQREELCAQHYPVPMGLTLNQWHQKMKNFLMGAEQVFSPSQACADIYQAYFSELSITVASHVDAESILRYPDVKVSEISEVQKLKVAVIGAISREKGADVFEHTACHKDPLNRLEFHLVGYAYKPLRETVVQHGAYRSNELAGILEEISPHIIWFPAQWPETYCYVLSEVMMTGLPVIASNLGSFPERLEGRPVSFVQSWNKEPEEWKNALLEIREWLINNSGSTFVWENSAFGKTVYRYSSEYLGNEPQGSQNTALGLDKIKSLNAKWEDSSSVGKKERLLSFLIRARELPVIRTLVRLIPFEVQRRIKRTLSHKPIHDIVHKR